jgi:hypothetical protein
MKQKCRNMKERDHNPARSIGVFLIVFGLMMGAVIFDVLNFGDRDEYIRWELFLIFIGLIVLFNRNVIGGLIMIAIGSYFILPELNYNLPEIFEQIYWPLAIVVIGLVFIVSGVVKNATKIKE